MPLLAVLIEILHHAVPRRDVFEPSWLLPITNTLFVTVICFAVAYLAARNYRSTGRAQALLLGGGVLAFGIGGAVAAFVRHLPEIGANLNVTVYNVGALIGGVFHFAAASVLLTGVSLESRIGRKRRWLAAAYAGPAALMTIVAIASVEGAIPPFFVQGVGPTAIRQGVLGTADLLFVFSFLIFMGTFLRNRERFLYWYSSALALTAISLTAFLSEESVGGAVGWGGRTAQYLSGIYFLVAIVNARRAAKARGMSLDDILTASLSPIEEKYRALAAHSPDLIARFDANLRHIYANPASLRVYGKTGPAVIGRTFEEAGLPEAFGRLWREKIRMVFETGAPTDVEGHLPAAGGPAFFHSSCVPEFGPDGDVVNVLVVSHDLTVRKRTEERIREQNLVLEGIGRIFRETLRSDSEEDLGRVCLKVAEEVTQSRFGFIGEVNEATGRLHAIAISNPGWRACRMEDVLTDGSPVSVGFAIHGLYGRAVLAQESVLTNDPPAHPDSIGTPAGHPPLTAFLGVPLMQNGVAIGIVAVANREGGYRPEDRVALETLAGPIVQVLMRRRAEQAVRQSEKWFRALAEALPQIAWTADARGRIEWTNRRWADFTGRSPATGESWSREAAPHPDDDEGMQQRWEEALRTGVSFQDEVRLRRRDGEYRWFLARAWPLRDAVGTVERWFGTSTDIHDIKQTQSALEELNATLEHRVAARSAEAQQLAEQLRALATELSETEQRERKRLAAVLHDHIQQLLVAAQMQLALVKRADPETIRSSTQGISSIINEAITASRSLTVELSPPVLHQAGLGAALGWLATRIGEQSSFTVNVRADHDAAPTNENLRFLLFESVRELLLNAVKHSGAETARVVMRRSEDGGTKITVEDDGRGFDPAALQSRQATDGGFGLFSIQQRLAHLGGRLTIDTAPGRGTRVELETPPEAVVTGVGKEAASTVAAEVAGRAVAAARHGKKISVLLVDDHRIMRQGLVSLLRLERDIEICGEAADGRQAVELARRHRPDVIVMDVNMPGMDGIEATRLIRGELPQCKVIGLSMHIDQDIAVAMRRAGAVGYLTKGGPSEDLVAAIRASVGLESSTADSSRPPAPEPMRA